MSVLVTGGGGFVGRAFADALRPRGYRIIVADLATPKTSESSASAAVDVRDEAAVAALLRRHAVTHVMHAAAVTAEPQNASALERLSEVNVLGTRAVCRAARRAGVQRVLVASSAAVYEDAAPVEVLDEATPSCPTSRYGASKLAAEQIALAEASGALDVRIARLGAMFGPFEAPTAARPAMSPLHDLIDRARSGRATLVREKRPLDWLYSRDAAEALNDLLLAPRLRHSTYNIGGGRPWSLILACEMLAQSFPGFTFAVAAETERADVDSTADRPPLSCARLAAEIAFAPRDPSSAIADYLRWLDASAAAHQRLGVPA